MSELKVTYSGGINMELDAALRECIEKFGYEWYAQGMRIKERIRDIVFDKNE